MPAASRPVVFAAISTLSPTPHVLHFTAPPYADDSLCRDATADLPRAPARRARRAAATARRPRLRSELSAALRGTRLDCVRGRFAALCRRPILTASPHGGSVAACSLRRRAHDRPASPSLPQVPQ